MRRAFEQCHCDSTLQLAQGNDESCLQRSMNQVCRVLENVELAVQSRVDMVKHEVCEREVITAVDLTRAGETVELESGPSILPLRVLILPRFSLPCSSVAQLPCEAAARGC